MKKILLLILVFASSNLFSQTKIDSTKADTVKWKKGGSASLNFSQVSLTNWSAGGENSLSAIALVNLFANYKKDKNTWENTLDMGYGLLQSGRLPFRKSDDKMEFTTKRGYKTKSKWYYAFLLNFKSQFAPGYNYPNDSVITSDFLAPGYFLVSTGMDYKPNDGFSFFASPLTGKITVVSRQSIANVGSFGVEKALFDSTGVVITNGRKLRYEFGALISIKFKKEIAKNVTISTKVDIFSNYVKNPQNIDVNWDMLIGFKVNKYISASITTTLIYDHDVNIPIYKEVNGAKLQVGIGPRTQFKEVLGIGFSYKF